MRKFGHAILGVVLLLLVAVPLSAAFTQCPPVGFAPGCNVLITLSAAQGCPGVGVVLDIGFGAFDGGDDSTVGVQNNSGIPVSSITLSGTGVNSIPIFDLEGDGACSGGYSPSPPPSQCAGSVTTYDPVGAGTTFSISNATTATINFSPPIANGGSAWFSVEDAFGAGGMVTVNGCATTIVAGGGGGCAAHAHLHSSTGSPGHFSTVASPHAHHAQHGTHLAPTTTCPPHAFGHSLPLTADPGNEFASFPATPDFRGYVTQDGKAGGLARRGSVVQLFGPAEGLYVGDEDNQPALDFTAPVSGSPLYHTDSLPVVHVGSSRAQVLFSGLAPGQRGVWQINFVVPADTPIGKLPVAVSYEDQTLTSIDIEVAKAPKK